MTTTERETTDTYRAGLAEGMKHAQPSEEIRKMVQEILTQTSHMGERVSSLEAWRTAHTVENAVVIEKLEDVRTTLSRLNWFLITGVAVALLNLVLK